MNYINERFTKCLLCGFFLCISFCLSSGQIYAQHNKAIPNKAKRVIIEYDSDGPVYAFDASEYLNSIKNYGIIPEANMKRLRIAIQRNSIHQPSDIMPYCTNTIAVDVRNYRDWSEEQIATDLYRRFAEELIPNLSVIKCSSNPYQIDSTINLAIYLTRLETTKGTYEEYTEFKKEVSNALKAYDLRSKADYYPGLFGRTLNILNNYLLDNHVKKEILVTENSKSPVKYFSLINNPSWSLHNVNTSKDTLNKEINTLIEYGVVPPISVSEQNGLIRKIRLIGFHNLTDRLNYQFFLRSFPSEPVVNVPGETSFYQSGYENQSKSFIAFMDSLRVVSKRVFNPQNISDNFAEELKKGIDQNRSFNFGFEIDGNEYKKTIEKKSVDDKDPPEKQYRAFFLLSPKVVLPIVNEALANKSIESRFYEVAESNTMSAIMFLTKKQFDYLKNRVPELMIDEK